MNKIIVYFANDHKAVFNLEEVSLISTGSPLSPNEWQNFFNTVKEPGKTMINLSSVCFIRKYEDKIDED